MSADSTGAAASSPLDASIAAEAAPPTGHPGVDQALGHVADLHDVPLPEHADRLRSASEALLAALHAPPGDEPS